MIHNIGDELTIAMECKDYCLDVSPHLAAISSMAGQKIRVIGHDGDGGLMRVYTVENEHGDTCKCWSRELI